MPQTCSRVPIHNVRRNAKITWTFSIGAETRNICVAALSQQRSIRKTIVRQAYVLSPSLDNTKEIRVCMYEMNRLAFSIQKRHG